MKDDEKFDLAESIARRLVAACNEEMGELKPLLPDPEESEQVMTLASLLAFIVVQKACGNEYMPTAVRLGLTWSKALPVLVGPNLN